MEEGQEPGERRERALCTHEIIDLGSSWRRHEGIQEGQDERSIVTALGGASVGAREEGWRSGLSV